MSTDNEALVWLAWIVSRRFGVRNHMLEEDPQLQKRLWVHPLLLLCGASGHFHKLFHELRRYPVKFVAFCRLSIPGFDLLHVLRPYLLRQDTCMRLSISPEERLLVTLRFLATGHSYSSLHFEFLLGTSTISGIVRSTCDVIWDKLKSRLMPQPNKQDWLRIAQGFMEATEFPNCIGALDGPASVEVSTASDTCSSGCVVGVGSAWASVSNAEATASQHWICGGIRAFTKCRQSHAAETEHHHHCCPTEEHHRYRPQPPQPGKFAMRPGPAVTSRSHDRDVTKVLVAQHLWNRTAACSAEENRDVRGFFKVDTF
ncbi:unnamed protein product [Ranitomeya imitator]|uniref:Transposase Helix-turn-helix domain-containing protein n=1 Tax=Ranitomeya imitator TaxID=111125 RepID=A0ABN9MKP0_9NEOB|nr:unnamed protein product [Ranitomeya imitator]